MDAGGRSGTGECQVRQDDCLVDLAYALRAEAGGILGGDGPSTLTTDRAGGVGGGEGGEFLSANRPAWGCSDKAVHRLIPEPRLDIQ